MQKAVAYLISTAAVVATALLGTLFTNSSVRSPWYACIKPRIAPPAWVFPVAWTIMYALLAFAFGISLRVDDRTVWALHVANLVLNVLWCYLFFGRKAVQPAMLAIVLLFACAIGIVVRSRNVTVKGLLAPYCAWIVFAGLLNALTLAKAAGCAP